VNRQISSPAYGDKRGNVLARRAAIHFLGGIFAPATSLLTAPILAHALGVDGRGELAAATAPLALIIAVAAVGLPEAVTYFVAKDPGRSGALVRRGALLIVVPAAVGAAVLVALSPVISAGDPTVRHLIFLSACFVLPALLLSIVRAVAAAHNRWTAITVERILTSTSRLVLLLGLFATGQLGLVNAAIVIFGTAFVGVVAYTPLLKSRNPQSATDLGAVSYTQFMRYSGGVWMGSLSGVILLRIDQVLLVPLAGTFQLGLYVVAVAVSEVAVVVNGAIRETAFTHLSEHGVSRENVGELSRISTLIVAAACLPLAAISPIAIPILFGTDFAGSIPVLLILLMAAALANPGSMAGVGLASSGSPHLRSLALLVACVVNIGLLLLLAPSLGAIGAAAATFFGYLTASNVAIAFMVAKHDVKFADFYRFRSSDFVNIWRLTSLALGKMTRRRKAG
jgi:O-antigen/teichoic acid export membrane protein